MGGREIGYDFAIKLELQEVTNEDIKVDLLCSMPRFVKFEPQKSGNQQRKFNRTKLNNKKTVQKRVKKQDRKNCTYEDCGKTYAFINDLTQHVNAFHKRTTQG